MVQQIVSSSIIKKKKKEKKKKVRYSRKAKHREGTLGLVMQNEIKRKQAAQPALPTRLNSRTTLNI